MDPSVTVDAQKTTLELKYLLSLKDKVSQEQTLETLNKLYPFTETPLSRLPPVELIVYKPGEVISFDLKQLIGSYVLTIIMGCVRVQKEIFYYDEQRIVDDSMKEKVVFNLNEGTTSLTALNHVTLIKVHKVWVKMAQQAADTRRRKYIQEKLLKIPFFAGLNFEEFDKVCTICQLKILGPGQSLEEQCSTPYHMYVIMQGELSLRKKVELADQSQVWKQVQIHSQKRNQYCQQLFEYLIRDPSVKTKTFSLNFQIKTVGQGTILCGTETLTQSPLAYSIVSTLKTQYIAIKYPDLYVLEQSRLADIRAWPTPTIDKRQLRRQYYYEKNWEDYKDYLMQDHKLSSMEAQHFEDFLRKNVNMAMKKYSYASDKVGLGHVTDSPAEKMVRIKQMTHQKRSVE